MSVNAAMNIKFNIIHKWFKSLQAISSFDVCFILESCQQAGFGLSSGEECGFLAAVTVGLWRWEGLSVIPLSLTLKPLLSCSLLMWLKMVLSFIFLHHVVARKFSNVEKPCSLWRVLHFNLYVSSRSSGWILSIDYWSMILHSQELTVNMKGHLHIISRKLCVGVISCCPWVRPLFMQMSARSWETYFSPKVCEQICKCVPCLIMFDHGRNILLPWELATFWRQNSCCCPEIMQFTSCHTHTHSCDSRHMEQHPPEQERTDHRGLTQAGVDHWHSRGHLASAFLAVLSRELNRCHLIITTRLSNG